ncbi:hypothetical protein ACFE04_031823 [Oxalis oulophora]
MSNNKVKGLLKGLRYISHVFEEKEPEMEIGNPTDVKHVAHIGWDGPSVNSAPTWMNEFQGPEENQSGPLSANGETDKENAAKFSDDTNQKHIRTKSSQSGMPDMPKTARRQSSSLQSEKSDKPKRKSSKAKDSVSEGGKTTRKPKDSAREGDSQGSENPKKSRQKKPKDKDTSVGGSTRSRNRAKSCSDQGEDSLSITNNNSEHCQKTGVNPFEDG